MTTCTVPKSPLIIIMTFRRSSKALGSEGVENRDPGIGCRVQQPDESNGLNPDGLNPVHSGFWRDCKNQIIRSSQETLRCVE
jgi:hypothetical protein